MSDKLIILFILIVQLFNLYRISRLEKTAKMYEESNYKTKNYIEDENKNDK